jgi:hypothetical protein
MLKEALEYFAGVLKPELIAVDARTYSSKPLQLVTPPAVPTFGIHTLTGFVEYVQAIKQDGGDMNSALIQVVNHTCVQLVATHGDGFGKRTCYAGAALLQGEKGFRFDAFMDREAFVIGVQSQFVQTAESRTVLEVASSLTEEAVSISEDDGIAQRTTLKRGISSLKQSVIVKGRVMLQPYRTFREVDQPTSEFIFRLKSQEGVPACALFEADGGKWQLDAMLAIKAWLDAKDLGLRVVA